ncbi:MAG: adenosylmethionine--8-amino-7-oxononanoate transaminase [Thermodesulfatator sp.]|nr:MAG: adenosylmethionine--8-amino-7-oxononanoate transaminase [Thermodesulfatator sp.]
MDKDRLRELDRKLIWHPYTQMKDFEKRQILFIDRGQGVYLYDLDENRYFDTISSWWCIVHGHNHPVIRKHIEAQLKRLDQVHFAGTTHSGPVLLAEKLSQLLPHGLEKFFYSDNGSTACEVAIKMSLQYWKHAGEEKREKFIALERGYHGDTIGTMSLGGVPAFEGPFQALTFDSLTVPPPYCYRCPCKLGAYTPGRAPNCNLECIGFLEKLLEKEGRDVAAIILEPMLMGAGGMISYPAGYLERVRELSMKYGVHLILDEVATGFGRTGRMFAMEHAGITPDFVCLSKGITGGTLPLAVTVTSQEIFNAFYADYTEGKTFFHGHTFTANPVCASAALGSLEVFEQERVMEHLPQKVERLQEGKMRFADIPMVGDIRGIGMVAAFELVEDPRTKRPFPAEKRVGWQVYLKGLGKGLILRPLSDVIYLFLPLAVTVDEIDRILELTFETISEVYGSVA